jgi:hypothetical protein
MYEYKGLARLTTAATLVLCVYAALDVLRAGSVMIQGAGTEEDFRFTEVFLILDFLLLVVCLCVVGRWIYRASSNAHAISHEMTISPGWAVGWYFIPFANLVKPLHAMREIWWASHEGSGSFEENAPILAWWWGLWLTTNIASNMAFQFEAVAPALHLIPAALNVALCAVLISVMREVTHSQEQARHERTFA